MAGGIGQLGFRISVSILAVLEGLIAPSIGGHLALPILVKTRHMLFFCFFFTLVTGPSRSLSLELSDTRVYEPQIRATLFYAGMGPDSRDFDTICYLTNAKPHDKIIIRVDMLC